MFTASDSTYTEEHRDFLQRRVSEFGFLGGATFLGFLAFRACLAVVERMYAALLRPDMFFHGLAGLCLLTIWLLCKKGSHSPRYIRIVESVGLIAAIASTVAMGSTIPLVERPDMIVLLACSYGMVIRSIFVPSSARYTFILCVVTGIPIVAGTYIQYLSINPLAYRVIAFEMSKRSAEQIALIVAIWTAVWWLFLVLICTMASQVIYGLRKEANEARKLGQYTLDKKLGEGGMGEVYLAQHAMLRRPTAIKLLHPDKAGEKNLVRFEREVQLTAELTHPNTVTIFDYGRTPDGVFYYAMEFLDGSTLDDIVAVSGAQPAARVVHVLEQVAAALKEAHGVGLIHRDIKPANIILCQRGGQFDVAKVVDFGLVKNIKSEKDVGLTSPNVITGTPLYLSPEAIRDPASTTALSDLYALGAVGYFLLTGTHVFNGKTIVEICGHHLHSPPEPPGERLGKKISEDLEKVLLSCLEKDPGNRPQGADALYRDLLRCDVSRSWDEEQSRVWWDHWGAELRNRRGAEQVKTVGETMLNVDFENRKRERAF